MSDSRLEKFIYAIRSMEVSDLPAPQSRNELYLMAILGLYDIDNLPVPLSRIERLLYEIATTPIIDESDLLFYLDGSNSENTTSVIKDLSGNGNDFVANNITLDATNGAIVFDGSSSYLINETLQPISTVDDSFSIEVVLECSLANSVANTILGLGMDSPNRLTYRLNPVEGDDDIYADFGSASDADLISTKGGTIDTDFNKKSHIVIVKEANTLKSYVNGTFSKSVTLPEETSTISIDPRVVIGTKYDLSKHFLNGKIYMFKLYTRVLTDGEILNNYNAMK